MDAMLLFKISLVGVTAGFLGGWLGVGGGALMVPMLILGFKTDTKLAIGTSLAVIVPIAIVSAIRHYSFGNVSLKLLWPMAVGGMLGALCGSWLLQRSSPEMAKRALAIFLVYSAVKLWMSSVQKA